MIINKVMLSFMILLLIPGMTFAVGTGSRIPSTTVSVLSNPAKKINIANIKAKYLLIDFWASWCASCRSSMGKISSLARSQRSKGLKVIGINLDKDRDKARQFLKRYPSSFFQLWDPSGKAAKRLGLSKVPSYYLIGPDKKVIAVLRGYKSGYIQKIKSMIK